jgi:Ca-activated chloride channel homolog
MKHGVLVGMMVAVLVAPPAHAAQQRGSPVEGGGSFTDAPLLTPGPYSDTIRLTEELFYAVELAEGQTLKVTAQLLGERGGPSDPGVLGQLQIYNSLRDRWTNNELESFDGVNNSNKWSIKTPEIGSEGREFSQDAEVFAEPGTYFFSLRFYRNVGPTRESPIRKREFKTRLKVKVTGIAVEPSPTATPTPETTPEPTPSETPGSSASGPTDDASSDAPYVRVYLMTFLIGLLVGFAVVVARGLAGRSAASRRA